MECSIEANQPLTHSPPMQLDSVQATILGGHQAKFTIIQGMVRSARACALLIVF